MNFGKFPRSNEIVIRDLKIESNVMKDEEEYKLKTVVRTNVVCL